MLITGATGALGGALTRHLVGEHGVNQLVSVPAIYHAVVRHPAFADLDVSRVRWISYGGAPIAESLVHRIKDAFLLRQDITPLRFTDFRVEHDVRGIVGDLHHFLGVA